MDDISLLNEAGQALSILFTFERLGFLFLGVIIGLIVGVIPGLGGLVVNDFDIVEQRFDRVGP